MANHKDPHPIGHIAKMGTGLLGVTVAGAAIYGHRVGWSVADVRTLAAIAIALTLTALFQDFGSMGHIKPERFTLNQRTEPSPRGEDADLIDAIDLRVAKALKDYTESNGPNPNGSG